MNCLQNSIKRREKYAYHRFIKKSGIALGVKVADKSEAIDKLVSLHENAETSRMLKPTKRESSNVKNSAQQP